MQLKCIVVDDSAIQRLAITKLVEDHPALELVAQYSSALETKKGLNTHKVDLIFLDIEMPILNGFQLLDVLNNSPEIIFVTGKTEHAFKAFNYDAVAYLKKPLNAGLFNTAVEKAIAQVKLKQNYTEPDEDYIFVKSNLKLNKKNIGLSVACDGVCLTLISIKSRIISLKQISIKAKFRCETQPQKEPRIAPLTTNHIAIKAKFKQEIQIKQVH